MTSVCPAGTYIAITITVGGPNSGRVIREAKDTWTRNTGEYARTRLRVGPHRAHLTEEPEAHAHGSAPLAEEIRLASFGVRGGGGKVVGCAIVHPGAGPTTEDPACALQTSLLLDPGAPTGQAQTRASLGFTLRAAKRAAAESSTSNSAPSTSRCQRATRSCAGSSSVRVADLRSWGGCRATFPRFPHTSWGEGLPNLTAIRSAPSVCPAFLEWRSPFSCSAMDAPSLPSGNTCSEAV